MIEFDEFLPMHKILKKYVGSYTAYYKDYDEGKVVDQDGKFVQCEDMDCLWDIQIVLKRPLSDAKIKIINNSLMQKGLFVSGKDGNRIGIEVADGIAVDGEIYDDFWSYFSEKGENPKIVFRNGFDIKPGMGEKKAQVSADQGIRRGTDEINVL